MDETGREVTRGYYSSVSYAGHAASVLRYTYEMNIDFTTLIKYYSRCNLEFGSSGICSRANRQPDPGVSFERTISSYVYWTVHHLDS